MGGQQDSKEFMLTVNTAFMKAGVAGVSILVASGDQGVCGRLGCRRSVKGHLTTRFSPEFPPSSPYVTAVGGTDFIGDDIGDEMVWNASGGGFSDVFPMPDYQTNAVKSYINNPDAHLPPQAYWNRAGRGFPDVSALRGIKTRYC